MDSWKLRNEGTTGTGILDGEAGVGMTFSSPRSRRFRDEVDDCEFALSKGGRRKGERGGGEPYVVAMLVDAISIYYFYNDNSHDMQHWSRR